MLFGEMRSELSRWREELSARLIRAQVSGDEPISAQDHNQILENIHVAIISRFDTIASALNCVERDLWETVGRKT